MRAVLFNQWCLGNNSRLGLFVWCIIDLIPISSIPWLPGLPGSIRLDTNATDGHRQGKKLKAYTLTFPSHSPNDGQASHCLKFIPLKFLSSSLVPYPMPCTSSSLSYTCTTIHRFWSPLLFPQAWVHAFPWAFRYSLDDINQNTSTTLFVFLVQRLLLLFMFVFDLVQWIF